MHHYFESITNKSGDVLVGYFARVIDPATQNTVTLAADNNGTPIVTVSGVENMAKSDENGNLSLYVEPGTYNLEIYAPNATSFILRVPNVAMNSGVGPQGEPGPEGPPGEGLETVMQPTGAAVVGFTQAGAGAVTRNALVKQRETFSLEDYGATGNDVTKDTAAMLALIAAAPAGSVIKVLPKTYLLNRTIMVDKPLFFDGGAKEQCVFNFAANGTYTQLGTSGERACVWFRHPLTGSTQGGAQRAGMTGITAQGNNAPGTNGIVASTPITLDEVDSKGHALDGFLTAATEADSGTAPVRGNANGCMFFTCIAQLNGRHGFRFVGNDANACTLTGCRAPQNGGVGFDDDSLLGNLYIGCESDNNALLGFRTNPAKPIRSTYLGCYSETPGHFSVGPLCVIIGSQGLYAPMRASGGVGIHGLPNGNTYVTTVGVNFALTDTIAQAGGGSDAPFMHVGSDGVVYKAQTGGKLVTINGLISSNFTTISNDGAPVISFANSAFAGNLNQGRLFYHNGFIVGGSAKAGIVGAGNAPPTEGNYVQGAIWLNDSPAAGGPPAWSCVTDGAPGVWKAWAALAA